MAVINHLYVLALVGALLACVGWYNGTIQTWATPADMLSFTSRSPLSLGTKTIEEEWNIMRHLGGYGPYVRRLSVAHQNDTLPAECRIDQVHVMARHAERFPTSVAGTHMLNLLGRIAEANVTLNGSLAFVNDWTFFTCSTGECFEQLTTTGSHAGTSTAFQMGVDLRTAYKNLVTDSIEHDTPIRVWASESQRVMDTAQYAMLGLTGIHWQSILDYSIIPETADQGANTLTPGDTCVRYAEDMDDFGWNYGSRMLDEFKATYLEKIQDRFLKENPALAFSINEIYVMQEMCGFELQARGKSEWCDVFTHDEWLGFEYARDVLHYYRSGSGNPYAATMGWLWLNATTANLQRNDTRMFLSFVHDGDIIPMLATLNILQQNEHLPVDHILQNRTWRISDTVPMGARIIFERIACSVPKHCWSNAPLYPNHIYCAPPTDTHFVRIKINDALTPLLDCVEGPGRSCPLEDFSNFIKERGEIGEFDEICGMIDDVPRALTFMDV